MDGVAGMMTFINGDEMDHSRKFPVFSISE